ncbi:hypothetical protein X798_00109 [Onchocerca flexuosa]|uniref:Secreted protein n=2 Tax=Onchocerca flexuosa TaxID=387005 RepID=A0A183HEB1_9BILA|nr:hypothetical protein X798_00109 [Onchocerca flexuosa]VDO44459.1 unnamed protein product [Onchocerca flexuosa]
MTVLGTVLAVTFIAFIWFLFGWRETRPKNSVETNPLEIQTAVSTSNSKFVSQKEKTETESINSQNLSANNSQISISGMKLDEISSTQHSDITNLKAGNSSEIQELQRTQDSIIIEKNDSSTRIDTRSKSEYFSDRIPSECHLEILPSLECVITTKSLEDPLTDELLSAIPVKDDSPNIFSLPSLETGVTVTDMTAEVPTAQSKMSVIEPRNLIEIISSTEDKVESTEDNKLMLQTETTTNASLKTGLEMEYSITKLRSNDTTSPSDIHTDDEFNIMTDSASDYTLVKKYLSNNYYSSDSEITITETSQKKSDHTAIAEI